MPCLCLVTVRLLRGSREGISISLLLPRIGMGFYILWPSMSHFALMTLSAGRTAAGLWQSPRFISVRCVCALLCSSGVRVVRMCQFDCSVIFRRNKHRSYQLNDGVCDGRIRCIRGVFFLRAHIFLSLLGYISYGILCRSLTIPVAVMHTSLPDK